jgi:DNA-binding Lrp family transcriptional regulator
MKEIKPLDYRLLSELVKNSRRSDRELAKAIGVSQPTITRRRALIEKELIDGYTAIPKWEKLGYELFAITLVKIRTAIASEEEYDETRKKGFGWLAKQQCIIMSGACRGMGFDSFMISIHRSYADYDEFLRNHRFKLGDFVEDVQSVFVNLSGKEILKTLGFRCLFEAE